MQSLADDNRPSSGMAAQRRRAVAHDVKDQLTTALLQAEMLRTPQLGPLTARQRVALEALERSVRRLEAMLNGVFDEPPSPESPSRRRP